MTLQFLIVRTGLLLAAIVSFVYADRQYVFDILNSDEAYYCRSQTKSWTVDLNDSYGTLHCNQKESSTNFIGSQHVVTEPCLRDNGCTVKLTGSPSVFAPANSLAMGPILEKAFLQYTRESRRSFCSGAGVHFDNTVKLAKHEYASVNCKTWTPPARCWAAQNDIGPLNFTQMSVARSENSYCEVLIRNSNSKTRESDNEKENMTEEELERHRRELYYDEEASLEERNRYVDEAVEKHKRDSDLSSQIRELDFDPQNMNYTKKFVCYEEHQSSCYDTLKEISQTDSRLQVTCEYETFDKVTWGIDHFYGKKLCAVEGGCYVNVFFKAPQSVIVGFISGSTSDQANVQIALENLLDDWANNSDCSPVSVPCNNSILVPFKTNISVSLYGKRSIYNCKIYDKKTNKKSVWVAKIPTLHNQVFGVANYFF